MLTVVLLAALASLLLYLYLKAVNATKYWERKGIKTLRPLPIVGNMAPVLANRQNVRELHMDLYNAYPEEPLTGFYDFYMPKLMVQDAEYAEKVLIKDFAYFTDHGTTTVDERNLPADQYHLFSLFSLNGPKWRAYRYKLSPLFTSGKLKSMYGAFDVVGDRLLEYFDKNPKSGIVMKDVMHLYAMDFIGLAVMGLNAKVLETTNSQFHTMGKKSKDFNSIQSAISNALSWLYGTSGSTETVHENPTSEFHNMAKKGKDFNSIQSAISNAFSWLYGKSGSTETVQENTSSEFQKMAKKSKDFNSIQSAIANAFPWLYGKSGSSETVQENSSSDFHKMGKKGKDFNAIQSAISNAFPWLYGTLEFTTLTATVQENPSSEFHKMAKKGKDFNSIQSAISNAFPWLYGKLGFTGPSETAQENPSSEFHKMGKKGKDFNSIQSAISNAFPWLYGKLGLSGQSAVVQDKPNSEFNKMGKQGKDFNSIQSAISNALPWIYGRLRYSTGRDETVAFFCKTIQDAVRYRQENNVQGNDFIQLMMQLREKGNIEIPRRNPSEDRYTEDDFAPNESFEITEDSLMAQAYTFMTAGLDSVAFAMMFLFYDLSVNQDIQDKAREEILEQKKLHGGLTYEALKDMKYLENVIKESFRIHPLTQGLVRVCTRDYTFPNGFKVERGQSVVVPALPMHLNPDYHPDPLEFKPERFEQPMKPGTYFPFGDGPRSCIAMRLALLQIKYGAALMLANYKLKLNSKTQATYRLKARSVDYEPAEPFYFDIERL